MFKIRTCFILKCFPLSHKINILKKIDKVVMWLEKIHFYDCNNFLIKF